MRDMFTDEEIEKVKRKIDELDGWWTVVRREISGVWIYSDFGETELRLLILPEHRLIISRVCFEHRRHGIMTALLPLLRDIALAHGLHEIVVQSVLTQGMASWCLKNGFRPEPGAILIDKSFLTGDYVLKIGESK